ncbi:MAG: hypothetical protein IKR67_07280 [Lachnospiraceae bacterium]|nr:hypothetical protein [Lachnospiraceae bacterium]
MKKFIAVVLLVIMCVPLVGCSMFFRPQTVSEDEVPLVSDETHYVIFSDGAFVSYEHEGNEITGCLAYIDCQTPEQAVEAVKSYKETEEMDEMMVDIIAQDRWLVIIYNSKAWEGFGIEELDASYGNQKVE